MNLKVQTALVYTAVVSLALIGACGKSTPSAPSPTAAGGSGGGLLLKAGPPNAISPTGGAAADDPLTLTASTTKGLYAEVPLTYHFQVRSGSTVVAERTVGPVPGSSVSYSPTGLDSETNYTWRVQAVYNGLFGEWSPDASFKSPEGAYIRGSEIRDPLTIGRTVGVLDGGAALTSDGVHLPEHTSTVHYVLPQTLEAGEFSMMIKGIDTSQMQGTKSKAFAMQEGFGDIITNDYRMTVDLRGRAYSPPGQVRFRIITGDSNVDFDAGPINPGWDASEWYFWKFTWQDGSAALEVRENSDTGPLKFQISTPTNGYPYRPSPQVIWLGAPIGRSGDDAATATGLTIKDVWVSANPRPHFPS
jgi:hypothetical protein